MCVVAIVDASLLSLLVSRHGSSDSELLNWFRKGHGILAFPSSTEGQYYSEIRNNVRVMELIRKYAQNGRLKTVASEQLSSALKQMDSKRVRSNDMHILALALASQATVLCSNDHSLGDDFKDNSILPRVLKKRRVLYPFGSKTKERRNFLNRRKCPKR